MKLFLDTSSLFKLYHQEDGTTELEKVFSKVKITHIFLSEISKDKLLKTLLEMEGLQTEMPNV